MKVNKYEQIKSLFKPPGLVVGILGRDGSGKSTFIEELAPSLAPHFNGIEKFKKFPAIFYKTAIFKKKEPHDNSKPHRYKERGLFGSFLKLNLIFAEFMLGYWIKIFPGKADSRLILYDRYFIDVLADPLRYRIKGNRTFIKVMHYLLPKPDCWIIIDLPSEVLVKRKQELSYEMAEKLRYPYLNLQQFLQNTIVINNDQELKKTVEEASKFILSQIHGNKLSYKTTVNEG